MRKELEFIARCLIEGYFPVFTHIKTGNKYQVLDVAINTTNANDGDIMIIYHPGDEDVPDKLFCRESSEFFNKFESISAGYNYRLDPNYDPSDDESDDANQSDYVESLKD